MDAIKRHPHTLVRDKTGLLIVDIQEKFRPAVRDFETIVENIVRLTLTFQLYDMPILVTEQYPQGLGATVELVRNQFDIMEPVEKLHFSCMRSGEFRQTLFSRELKTVVVCGIESHVCVNQTVHDLLAEGFAVHVVADAVGSRNPVDHATALEKMYRAGVVPATTEMVLFELTEKAGTPEFKNIQHMVKSKIRPDGRPSKQKPVAAGKRTAAAPAMAETDDESVFEASRAPDVSKEPAPTPAAKSSVPKEPAHKPAPPAPAPEEEAVYEKPAAAPKPPAAPPVKAETKKAGQPAKPAPAQVKPPQQPAGAGKEKKPAPASADAEKTAEIALEEIRAAPGPTDDLDALAASGPAQEDESDVDVTDSIDIESIQKLISDSDDGKKGGKPRLDPIDDILGPDELENPEVTV